MIEKLLFIIVMVIALYLSINVIQKFSIKFDLLSEIIKELNQGYIEDIVLTNSPYCPIDYDSIINQSYWPGSYKGCGCKADDIPGANKFNFYSNYCPKLRECYSVEETQKQDFNLWRGYNICIKRADIPYSKLELVQIKNKNEIKCNNSTYHICGIIDGKTHVLCIPPDRACPINEIKIQKIKENFKNDNDSSINSAVNINTNDHNQANNHTDSILKEDKKSGLKLLLAANSEILDNKQSILSKGKDTSIKFNSGFKNFAFLNKNFYFDKSSNKLIKAGQVGSEGSNRDSLEIALRQININNSKKSLNRNPNIQFLQQMDINNNNKNSNERKLEDQNTKIIKPNFTQHSDGIGGFYTLNLKDYQIIFSKNPINISNLDQNKKLPTIPIFFRVEGNTPCLDPLKKPSKEFFFPLMKNKYDFICDLTDNKTEIIDEKLEIIDSYPYDDYIKENNLNFYHDLDDVLDKFKINLAAKTIFLYSRNYLGWSNKCLDSSPDSLQNFLKMEENLNHILIMNILHSFISIGMIIALGIFACFLSKYFEVLFKLINLGFCIFNLIFPIQIISTCNWIINLFTDEDGIFCGDNTLNILLIDISNSCLEMTSSYIWILLITIFYSFFFIYMLYSWIKPFHQEYQEKFKKYTSLK